WARLSLARSVQMSWGWTALGGDSLNALAFSAARRAVELDSMSAEAHLATGMAESDRGNKAEAREQFERAIRLDSLNAEAFHLYGTIYGNDCPRQMGCLDDHVAGAPLFRRALALDPTLRNSWRHLARLERDAGQLALAEAHLDTALSFGPWAP